MKIKSGLPKFSKPTMLLTVGLNDAHGLITQDDQITEAFSLHVAEELYFDKDSFTRGISGSGSRQHDLTMHVFHDHIARTAGELMKKHLQNKTAVAFIIFVPKHLHNIFLKALPSVVRQKIVRTLNVDVLRETPFQLLKRLELK